MAYPTPPASDVPTAQDSGEDRAAQPGTLAPELRAALDGTAPRSRGWRLWAKRGAWVLVLAAISGGIAWRIVTTPTAQQMAGPPGGPPPGGPGGPPPGAERGGRFGAMVMPVVVARTKDSSLPIELNALGTVTSLATATVRPQVGGQIMEITYTEGQTVKEGDPLAKIDPRNYQLALEQAQAQLLKDQALLKNAETDLERYRLLVQKDSIAKQQYDNQQSLVLQYKSAIKADQALVDKAALDLSRATVTAPFAGRIGLRLVDVGNTVQANDATGIAVVTQIKPISVLFTVPEDEVPAIMKRMGSGASLPVVAYDRGRTKVLAEGVLTTVDNQVDTSTGTVKLRARFDNADESLFPNQFVNIRLQVDTKRNVMTIPAAAVQRGAPGTFVYLVGAPETPPAGGPGAPPPAMTGQPGAGPAPGGEREQRPTRTVSVRPIKLGLTSGEQVEVIEGLASGDLVVMDGADRLREGSRVTIANTFAGSGLANGDNTTNAGNPRPPNGEGRPSRNAEGRGANAEGARQPRENRPPTEVPPATAPQQKP